MGMMQSLLDPDRNAAALVIDPWSLADWRGVSRGPPGLHTPTRDEPVNLSDSGLETHQHCSPAGANYCQSLLLDPDTRMGIDLHKRLFLLVTGRGEYARIFLTMDALYRLS
jgi:hypothetical protein